MSRLACPRKPTRRLNGTVVARLRSCKILGHPDDCIPSGLFLLFPNGKIEMIR